MPADAAEGSAAVSLQLKRVESLTPDGERRLTFLVDGAAARKTVTDASAGGAEVFDGLMAR